MIIQIIANLIRAREAPHTPALSHGNRRVLLFVFLFCDDTYHQLVAMVKRYEKRGEIKFLLFRQHVNAVGR